MGSEMGCSYVGLLVRGNLFIFGGLTDLSRGLNCTALLVRQNLFNFGGSIEFSGGVIRTALLVRGNIFPSGRPNGVCDGVQLKRTFKWENVTENC